MKVVAIIPAAGLGTRMGKPSAESAGTSRKQFMLLAGAPILVHTIRKFAANGKIVEIIVAIRAEDRAEFEANLAGQKFAKPVRFADGGRSRQESVAHALADVPPGTDLVAVHDAVRPFVTMAQIDEAIARASETGAAILGIPAMDTVKQVDRTRIRATLPRERIVLAQTPQVFRFELLKRAFEKAHEEGFTGTDEASLVEHLGEDVHVVLGSDRNIKITRPSDMALARLFYEEELEAAASESAAAR